jgi:hypothetical protein
MNTQDDNTDLKFRQLFEKTGLDSPSAGFTGNVMNKIAQLSPQAQAAPDKRFFRGWAGGIGIALLAILGLGGMYYFDIGILPERFKPIFAPVFGKIFDSFTGIFDSVEVSGTTIAIILGFAFLIILERILGRFRITRNMYFSF